MVELPMIRASGIVKWRSLPRKLNKAAISYCLQWLVLLNDDLSVHPMVNGTEVRVSSCCREGVGEALVRLQYRRLLELIVVARHGMGHAVMFSSSERCPTGTVIVGVEKLRLSITTTVIVAL